MLGAPESARLEGLYKVFLLQKIGIFKPREKWIPHFKPLKILKSLSHDSLAWMRIFCAERSRADWDWELWMALLEAGVDGKEILMETSLIRKKHSATQTPSSFWCRRPPLFFWMNHRPLLSGWNKFISFKSCLLAFPCWDLLLAPQLLFHGIAQDTPSSHRVSMGMPALAIFCPAFPSPPTQHIHLSALDGLAWDPSHFLVRCRVWTHPAQWPSLAGKREEDLENHN